jgi:hypothetical protein
MRLKLYLALALLMLAAGTSTAQQPVLRWAFTPIGAGDQFGFDVASIGDVDGDGLADVAAVANVDDAFPNPPYPGFCRVMSGGTGNLIYTFWGEQTGDYYGYDVDDAGDVNADGVRDIVVGAVKWRSGPGQDPGRIYVYSGATGAILHVKTGEAPGDRFGYSCAGVGDVDADGYDDFAAGARQHDGAGIDAGRVYVYSGASGALLHVFDGAAAQDHLGNSVARAGDVDGDGHDDILGGATESSTGGFHAGACYLWSGATGALLHAFYGTAFPGLNGAEFGAEAHSVGDLTGDGRAEILVASEEYDVSTTSPDDTGRVYLYDGATYGLITTFTGQSAGGQFGNGVGGGGDIDGDGTPDIVIGADQTGFNGANSGRAYAYSGATFASLFTITGSAAGVHLGQAIAADRDIDGDGRADVIVSAFLDPAAGALAGRVLVYHGPGHAGPVLAHASAAGNLTGAGAQPESILYLNGSTGGTQRRVDVASGRPLDYLLAQPSANAGPAQHVTWVWLGVPGSADAATLPFGLGQMAFTPCELNPGAPVVTLANSFGSSSCPALAGGATATPYALALVAPPFPVSVTFQAIVERTPGQLRVTNAVIADIN